MAMNTQDIRLECLKLAVNRNQKLGASAENVVFEANIYEKYLKSGFTKSNRDDTK